MTLSAVKTMPRMMFVQRFVLSSSIRVRKGIITAISTRIANSSRNSGVIVMPATSPSIKSSIMPGSMNESSPAPRSMRDDIIHSTEIFSFNSKFSSFFSPPSPLFLLFRNRTVVSCLLVGYL